MGFELTNKPPAMASSASAFKPIPSLPSAALAPRSLTGPAVSAQNLVSTTPRPPLKSGTGTAQTLESPTPIQEDALNFFSRPEVPPKRHPWYFVEDPVDKAVVCRGHLCPCPRASASRVVYQPSTAAHTIQRFNPEDPPLDSNNQVIPFRLLDLPGEMRNRVYRAALSPDYISFRSCAVHSMPIGLFPPVTTGILVANKQIARESKDFIMESTFIVNISLEGLNRPVIHPRQLPDYVLPKVQQITLVIDFTRVEDKSPHKIDWRTLQQLTSLKSVRICAIQLWPPAAYWAGEKTMNHHQVETIKTILECVPKDCVVECGWASQTEEDHVVTCTGHASSNCCTGSVRAPEPGQLGDSYSY